MLGNASLWVTVPVKDLTRAKKFYEDVLGLEHEDSMEGGVEQYLAGEGTRIILYQPRENLTEWGKSTRGVFIVDDLESCMADLQAKGVEFERLNYDDLKSDENYIVMEDGYRSAWFFDSEGNSFCLSEAAS